MSTPTKLGAFALCLAASFGLAAGVGAAVGPIGATSAETREAEPADRPDTTGEMDNMPGMAGATSSPHP